MRAGLWLSLYVFLASAGMLCEPVDVNLEQRSDADPCKPHTPGDAALDAGWPDAWFPDASPSSFIDTDGGFVPDASPFDASPPPPLLDAPPHCQRPDAGTTLPDAAPADGGFLPDALPADGGFLPDASL